MIFWQQRLHIRKVVKHNMNDKFASVLFDSSVEDIEYMNSSFDKGVLRIAYHGDNANGSSISKEVFEQAIPSMFNCPVVCRYIREDDNIGGHDVEIVRDSGGIRMVNITHPVGVVPESANYWWEEVAGEDGTVREYLCADVLLWKRQEAYEYIKQNGIVSESMEITIQDMHKRSDGYSVYDKFEFTAFCLLGDGIQPCFEDASLRLYERSDIMSDIAEMMRDLKREFALISSNQEGGTGDSPKGGNDKLNLDDLLAKYELTMEDITFETDGLSDEELEAKVKEVFEAKSGNANPEVIEHNEPEPDEKFALARADIMSALNEELRKHTFVENLWGEPYEFNKYYLIDYDADLGYVYVEDSQDGHNYRMSYRMDGDKAVVDYNSAKRVKTVFVDYEDGAPNDSVQSFASVSFAKSAFDSVFSKMNDELTELRKFKKDKEDEQRMSDMMAIFERFKCLEGIAEFESLRSSIDELDLTAEQLEEKCYAIKGRAASTASFSLGSPVRLPVGKPNADDSGDEPYGGLFLKYGSSNN